MNYRETTQYIFNKLPMYQRIGAAAYKADLNTTLQLMELAGHPEQQFRSVHIAGTNGKGSVSNLLASVFQESGLKTGLYTSPHLTDFRERVRINGNKVPENYVIAFIEKWEETIELLQPSFFEISVLLAFSWFAEQAVDIAVIEVGMGGRLDSTNVITPLLSVITNIGLDHTMFLGTTKREIAAEKAGIIKNHIPVIIGEFDAETYPVFCEFSTKTSSPMSVADKNFTFRKNDTFTGNLNGTIYKDDKEYISISCPLTGNYQNRNFLTTIAALNNLIESGFHIEKNHIQSGFLHVKENTGFRGRWDIVSTLPLTICDVGHNADGLHYVMKQLSEENSETIHYVFGVNNDKNLSDLFSVLPDDGKYYFCNANVPRAMKAQTLSEDGKKRNFVCEDFPSVKEAYLNACKNAGKNDIIFIGGSTFIVAEFYDYLENYEKY